MLVSLDRHTEHVARVVGVLAVVLDAATRLAMILVASALIAEFATKTIGPNGDGIPPRIFVPPLVAYVLWNLAMLRWSFRWCAKRAPSDSTYLIAIAIASLVRVRLLGFLAGDVMYHERNMLEPLAYASWACVAFAIAAYLLSALDRGEAN